MIEYKDITCLIGLKTSESYFCSIKEINFVKNSKSVWVQKLEPHHCQGYKGIHLRNNGNNSAMAHTLCSDATSSITISLNFPSWPVSNSDSTSLVALVTF